MKTLKRLLLSILAFMFTIGLTACDFGPKAYESSDINLFTFSELEDGTYAVSAKEGVTFPELLKIPNSYNGKDVTAIKENGFKNISGVKKLHVPTTVKSVGKMGFSGILTLESVELYSGVVELLNGAFYGCEKLESIELPSTLKTIGDCAFLTCKSLKRIECNDQLEKIGASAFKYCENLTSVHISHSVKEIGKDAFTGCDKAVFVISESNIYYKLGADGKPVKI